MCSAARGQAASFSASGENDQRAHGNLLPALRPIFGGTTTRRRLARSVRNLSRANAGEAAEFEGLNI
jgi:tRNA G10  N-methylase Trm11